MSLTRRDFLAAGLALPLVPRFSRADPTPLPCPSNAWEKGPILLGRGGSALPDVPFVQNFTCRAEPIDGDRWRLWYSVSGKGEQYAIGYAEGAVGGAFAATPAVTSPGEPPDAPLSIGNLPEGWRPVQPIHVPLPDGRHRLYFWAHGKDLHRYLAAESDDGRRYRVLDPARPCLYHPNDRAVSGAIAVEAGLKRLANKKPDRPADEPPAPARLVSNDATNLYRLPDGTWEMYSVALVEVGRDDPRYIAHDNAAGWVRVIDRYTSPDGLDWTDRRRVLVPDAEDPSDQQFYHLAVTHTDRGRVGMLGHYRVGAQTMDLEWCVSRDGITWERPRRDRPWLPRGQGDAPDAYGIYPPSALVHRDGRWWLFFTGTTAAHNGRDSRGEPGSVVRVASTPSIWA